MRPSGTILPTLIFFLPMLKKILRTPLNLGAGTKMHKYLVVDSYKQLNMNLMKQILYTLLPILHPSVMCIMNMTRITKNPVHTSFSSIILKSLQIND